ncbi:MAG: AraC family transcriptional regulator [Clostridia bacterium]|nr:AraC family transcriptional regulator [Clostridia bacterium]
MLIEYGNMDTVAAWEPVEEVPSGYSRIYYITKGDAIYEAAGDRRHLTPDHLYVFPSMIPYRVWHESGQELEYTYLYMDFPKHRVNGLIELQVDGETCLHDFAGAVRKAICEDKIDLLEHLADAFPFFLNENEHFIRNSAMLNDVQKFVSEHLSEEITIEDMSRIFGYHPNYFIRLFRSETGRTPYRYIMQMRMQHAVRQLNKGMPNDEVCHACGFTDSSTFTRAFRKYFGVTPQKYRKGCRIRKVTLNPC